MSEKSHVHAGKERQNTDRRKDETTRNEGRDRNAGKERERVCVCVCVCVTKERQTDRQTGQSEIPSLLTNSSTHAKFFSPP